MSVTGGRGSVTDVTVKVSMNVHRNCSGIYCYF